MQVGTEGAEPTIRLTHESSDPINFCLAFRSLSRIIGRRIIRTEGQKSCLWGHRLQNSEGFRQIIMTTMTWGIGPIGIVVLAHIF
jgi:hypothetical protein